MANHKIIGHQSQLNQIESDIKQNNLSHAYLFSGPAQIGKFTLARHLAQILQCTSENCEKTCPTCQQIQKGQHFDTIEFADDGHSLKIATLRELIKRINLTNQGNYTCIIIKNIERMTIATSNCLLKSLEEPPQKTIFFLTTSKPHSILETITSRSRQVNFQQIPAAQLQSALTERFPDKSTQEITDAITFSMKKPGKAIQFLENPEELESLHELNNSISSLLSNSTVAERFKLIETLAADKTKALTFLSLLNIAIHARLLTESDSKTQSKYQDLIQNILNIPKLLNQNVNTRLLFENLLLPL